MMKPQRLRGAEKIKGNRRSGFSREQLCGRAHNSRLKPLLPEKQNPLRLRVSAVNQ